MTHDKVNYGDTEVTVISLDTVIVGTGAAGYNTALSLYKLGKTDIAVVTEGVNMGTSRNTGSDKQTYYKLNLCGDYDDSPMTMAKDLFAGHCVDGDLALVEAALSTKCFLRLCELGVSFPVNRYGEYIGYKTDHDPHARATSVGPLTSKMMTEQLQKAVEDASVKVFDNHMVVAIIKNKERAVGLLALRRDDTGDEKPRFVLFRCGSIVFAAGGPAGIYSDTVYPAGHSGSSGIAFEAGVKGKNLTEWQYGLASTTPRWNVSGTYMQVLPRFVSVDEKGEEHEFLADYFKNPAECLSMVFKKGYEWPFDSRKVIGGSSVIDLLVYRERVLFGRKVFLDFRKNPFSLKELPYDLLAEEAREYLKNAGACFGTPIERLLHMNSPAVELYARKGVDLKNEMLEIALCAQHNNGGLNVDLWWKTNLDGFFAAGEAAGTHGVYRPGGSALNAGQVGSTRAAQYIAERGLSPVDFDEFSALSKTVIEKHIDLCHKIIGGDDNVSQLTKTATDRMSAIGGAIRDVNKLKYAADESRLLLENFENEVCVPNTKELWRAYRLRDVLICQTVYLSAMADYAKQGGKSRGSALYTDKNGDKPEELEEIFRFIPDDHSLDEMVQEIEYDQKMCVTSWRKVRPLPESGGFFENVWRQYRENKNVF